MSKAKAPSKFTEDQVPKLARAATGSAYRRAKQAGGVVVHRHGELLRIEDGKECVIKKLEPRVRIAKGSRFEIKAEPA